MPMQKNTSTRLAYVLALVTVTVWGLTFISTKVLLGSFAPVEILFYRFLIGFLALCVMRPHVLRMKKRAHHAYFAAAGLMGVCLYFLLENIALQFCTASNISVTVATAPMFIAIVASVINRRIAFSANFVVGFVVAIVGIVLTSFADVSTAQVGLGDVLAICAALTWAFYSNIINKLTAVGYETIAVTKRCFAWGLVFILLCMPFMGARVDLARFADPANTGNLLFLGLVASAACFAMWGYAVSCLGPTRTGAFIYLSPVITVVAGVVILGESLTAQVILGIILVLGGLILSEWKRGGKASGEAPAEARGAVPDETRGEVPAEARGEQLQEAGKTQGESERETEHVETG